jgi:hypothetical protein
MKLGVSKLRSLRSIRGRDLLTASLMIVSVTVTAVAVGFGVARELMAIPAGLLAAWLAVWFVFRPAAALFSLAAVFLLVDHWASTGSLPRQITLLPDLVFVSFAARFIVLLVAKRIKSWPQIALVSTIAALALLCVVSAIIDYPPDAEALLGMRAYLRWPLLLLLTLVIGISSRTMKRLVLVIAGMAVIQLVATGVQWAQTGGTTDTIVGTLSRSATVELFMLCTFALIILVAMALHVRGRGRGAALLAFLAALVCLPPVFGFVRLSLFATPAMLLALLGYGLLPRVGIHNWRRVAIVASVLALSLGIAFGTVHPLQSAVEKNLTGITGMSGNTSGRDGTGSIMGGVVRAANKRGTGTVAGKLTSIRVAHSAITDSATTRIFGLGVGYSTTHKFVSGHSANKIAVDVKRTQLSATTADLGYAGVLALFAVLGALLFTVPRLRGDPDSVWAAIGWGAPVAALLFICALIYAAGWTSGRATPFVFWMLVAAPYVRDRELHLRESGGEIEVFPWSMGSTRLQLPHWIGRGRTR